jgi:uncharacterized protein
MSPHSVSRRTFLQSASLAIAGASLPLQLHSASSETLPLEEFGYADVTLTSELHEEQLRHCHSLLMSLDEDALMKPMRQMGGQPAPGPELGGWYQYVPDYDWHTFDVGFAPSATFGQWVSALARMYAINPKPETRDKVLRLNRLYAQTVTGDFYAKNRFPTYCYDKLVCGLIDSHKWVGDPEAFKILEKTTDTALPHFPGKAIEHGKSWRPGTDESWTWDESYTIAENLFLAYQRGAGDRYRTLGTQYLDDEYYGPLSEGRSNLAGRHAYSHVNSLSSAMQAYLTLGSEKHLRAAKNAFDMLTAQSFVTGGWGPGELLRAPGSNDVFESLTDNHSSFETPCGAYAHFKLTRYLMRVTRESRYGDSMERMMYNTILGAKPMDAEGRTFYYSDNTFTAKKVFSDHRWPCCSGTMPQVAADYRINTYLRDPQGIYVNLYIPSTVRWTYGGAQVSLTQKSGYPFESVVNFEVTTSKPAEFAINFRIPSWVQGSAIAVNGKRVSIPVTPGSFASLRREWRNGDRIEVELPMTTRLEAVDERHSETVALMHGPLVLFAITKSAPKVTRQQLLAARKTGTAKWQVETASGPMTMLPFIEIADEQYSTYVKAS